MGKSEQPKRGRHRMERPSVVFSELHIVKALGIYCWSVQYARGQVGTEGGRGLGNVPREVGSSYSLQAADESCVSDTCPWRLYGDEPTQWSSGLEGQSGFAVSRNRWNKKDNQTSWCYKQRGLELEGLGSGNWREIARKETSQPDFLHLPEDTSYLHQWLRIACEVPLLAVSPWEGAAAESGLNRGRGERRTRMTFCIVAQSGASSEPWLKAAKWTEGKLEPWHVLHKILTPQICSWDTIMIQSIKSRKTRERRENERERDRMVGLG